MARPNITSTAALKGKKVAVSWFGATPDLSARAYLEALSRIGYDGVWNADVEWLCLLGFA
jgi:hypothetical protein